MKKYTNKILLITLIIIVALCVVVCTVEIRKTYHNGQIPTTEEFAKEHSQNNSDDEIPELILEDDTIRVINGQTGKEE